MIKRILYDLTEEWLEFCRFSEEFVLAFNIER